MKILLADVPAYNTMLDKGYPNLGLLYIAGSLRNNFGENELQVSYLDSKHNLQDHIDIVKKSNPNIYGLSFTSKASGIARKIIEKIRKELPSTWIICGGAHPTAMPHHVMLNTSADVCVVGEGEITMVDLVKAIKTNNDLINVEGIYYKNNGEIQKTSPRSFIENLDDIQFPAWDLIDFEKYEGTYLKIQTIEGSLLISRGCPYDCAFCSNPVWKSSKPWIRYRSAENICQEIEILYNRGVREIYMCSDELNFSENWAKHLCKRIIQLNYKDLYFQCNMRADKVSKELACLLSEMNCWLVRLGIESGNDRVLKAIGKHVTTNQINKATQILSQFKIKIFAFMMLYNVWEDSNTLCYETTEEVENSIRFMKKLFKKDQIHYMSWQFCTPMPGSRLYNIACKYDLFRDDPQKIWEGFDEHSIAMYIPSVSERVMKWKIKKGIIIKDYFMLRSGQISFKHLWRVKENLKALMK